METFAERLEFLLKEKRRTQSELAEQLHIRRPTISDWKKNGAVPAGDICFRIADYLGVDCRWLVTGEERGDSQLTAEERELLEKWEELDEHEKAAVRAMVASFLEQKAAETQTDLLG